jgi:hypothetical protein
MIALVIAIAATAAADSAGRPVLHEMRPCAQTRTCVIARDESYDLRLAGIAQAEHDIKMDAYRVNPRPCGLIGNLRCPGRGRELFRMGEPVRETIARSFGLD